MSLFSSISVSASGMAAQRTRAEVNHGPQSGQETRVEHRAMAVAVHELPHPGDALARVGMGQAEVAQ